MKQLTDWQVKVENNLSNNKLAALNGSNPVLQFQYLRDRSDRLLPRRGHELQFPHVHQELNSNLCNRFSAVTCAYTLCLTQAALAAPYVIWQPAHAAGWGRANGQDCWKLQKSLSAQMLWRTYVKFERLLTCADRLQRRFYPDGCRNSSQTFKKLINQHNFGSNSSFLFSHLSSKVS